MSVSRQGISCYVGQTDTLNSTGTLNTHTHTLTFFPSLAQVFLWPFLYDLLCTVHSKPVRQQSLCLSVAVCMSSEVADPGAAAALRDRCV